MRRKSEEVTSRPCVSDEGCLSPHVGRRSACGSRNTTHGLYGRSVGRGCVGSHKQKPPPGPPRPPHPPWRHAGGGQAGCLGAASLPTMAGHDKEYPAFVRRIPDTAEKPLPARPLFPGKKYGPEPRSENRQSFWVGLAANAVCPCFSPHGEAKCMTGSAGRGARRLPRATRPVRFFTNHESQITAFVSCAAAVRWWEMQAIRSSGRPAGCLRGGERKMNPR